MPSALAGRFLSTAPPGTSSPYSKLYILMNLAWNHHHNQDREHFHYVYKFLNGFSSGSFCVLTTWVSTASCTQVPRVSPSIIILAHQPSRDPGPHAEPGSKGNVEELGSGVCVCVFPFKGRVALPSTTLRGGGISELSNLKPWLKPETTEIPGILQC